MGFPIDTTNVGGVASSHFGYGHAGRQPQGYYPYGPQQRNYCYGRPGTEAKPFMQRTLQLTKDIPDASQGFPQYSEYASRSCPPGTVLYSSEVGGVDGDVAIYVPLKLIGGAPPPISWTD